MRPEFWKRSVKSKFWFCPHICLLGFLIVSTACTTVKIATTPLKEAPEFSFSLTAYKAGELDENCKAILQTAKNSGFSAVSLVPSRVFSQNKISALGVSSGREIETCLQNAWEDGLDIIYQPHVESEDIIDKTKPNVWRAYFDFTPDENYFQLMFAPFLNWLSIHRDEIKKEHRFVAVVVAAELELSTTKYSGQWVKLVSHLKSKLQDMDLKDKVKIGFNPNSTPKDYFRSVDNSCSDFVEFVKGLDFVAPSIYGDWSKIYENRSRRGADQIEEKVQTTIKALSFRNLNKCYVSYFRQIPLFIGEFGVGGDFNHASKVSGEGMRSKKYTETRRDLYANLIDWAKSQKNENEFNTQVINIWTNDFFDPVGIGHDPRTQADDRITKFFVDYRNWLANLR